MRSINRLSAVAAALALATGSASAADLSPTGRALALLRSHGALASTSAKDGFVARNVIVDADGTEHVRFDRTYDGLPVIGGDVVMHSSNGRFKGVSTTRDVPLLLSVRPSLTTSNAIAVGKAAFGAVPVGAPESRLVVYARDVEPRLAWQVRVENAQADMTYIVDAHDRRILDRWSNRETAIAAGKAKTLYSGEVALATNSIVGGYELRDPSRGGMRTIEGANLRTSGQIYKDTDNLWGTGTNTDRASAAADAQYGAAVTWDYYKLAHGRLGIAGNGKGAYSRVHYGTRYSNAYWNDSCFCMTYGDGDGVRIGPLVALDITGHEMSHGVNAQTANLIYSGESGGLNEANSDILGTMVEFHAYNAQDKPDYMIGEEIFLDNVSGSANQIGLRYMFKPNLDKRSPNCWSPTLGTLDVHYSSGVANLFFYLLAEGTTARTYNGVNHTPTTCNGTTFAGIGRANAAKIWYRALTVYFTSGTNYAGARAATIAAANDLHGIGSVESRAVATAWSAVAVN